MKKTKILKNNGIKDLNSDWIGLDNFTTLAGSLRAV
jgi:hypothetical protein